MMWNVRWLVPTVLAIAGASLSACSGDAPAAQAQRGPRPTAVRAAEATASDLVLIEEYPGELVADAVDLAPNVVGKVLAVEVEVGDRVRAGDVVARLDPAQLRQQLRSAEAQVRASKASEARVDARIAAARAELERKEPLASRQLVSAQELAELRAELGALEAERAGAVAEYEQGRASAAALREQLGDLSLRAPWDAIVASRQLEPGSIASASTPVVRLVRAGPLEVRFRVPERDAAAVRAGLPLRVRTQATAADRFTGKVLRVAGEVSRADRSLLVEGVLDGEVPVLRAGMFATVELTRDTLRGAITVPSAALLQRQGADGIFVAAGSEAKWRPVQIRGEEGGTTAIEGEVAPGDQVLVFGHDDLADGAPINVAGARPPVAEGEDGGGT